MTFNGLFIYHFEMPDGKKTGFSLKCSCWLYVLGLERLKCKLCLCLTCEAVEQVMLVSLTLTHALRSAPDFKGRCHCITHRTQAR